MTTTRSCSTGTVHPVETWRERYPYDERMPRKEYEQIKRLLQIDLIKLQRWSKRTGARDVIVFEGRDAAGKDGTIQRFMEHLNPRGTRVVAPEKPKEQEKAQRYFQRYVTHLPTAGERVLFDRWWCNRAGVETVMGFCIPDQARRIHEAGTVIRGDALQRSIHLTKFWFSVSPAEKRTRFAIRLIDPLRQWKLSSMDMESINRWQAYTDAKKEVFLATDTDYANSSDRKKCGLPCTSSE